MNRREFLKAGLATLASAWCVSTSKGNVVADEKVAVPDVVEEKIESEWPINCESCFRYLCGPECPHWWDRPYFLAGGLHRILTRPEPWEENIEAYYHVTDLGIEADRHPSPEYARWKEKNARKETGLGDF